MSHNSRYIFVASTILSLALSPLTCFATGVHEYAPKHDSVHPDFQLETIDPTNNILQISLWHEHIAGREPAEIGVLWSNDDASTLPTLEMETTDYPWATEVYRSKNLRNGVTQDGKTTWIVQSEVSLKNNSSHLLYAYVKFDDGGYFNTKVNYNRCFTTPPVWTEGMVCVPYSYLYVPDNGIEYMAKSINEPLITDEDRRSAETAAQTEAAMQEHLNQAQEKLELMQEQLDEAYDILAEMRELYERTKREADRAEVAANLAEEKALLSEEYASLAEEARAQAEDLKVATERLANSISDVEARIEELKVETEMARDVVLAIREDINAVRNEIETEVEAVRGEMSAALAETSSTREDIRLFREEIEKNKDSSNNIYNMVLNKFQDFESRINSLGKVETIYYGGGSGNWVAQDQQNQAENGTQTLENVSTKEINNENGERLHVYTPTRKEDEEAIDIPKLGIADCSINIWPWIMAGAVLGIAFTSILFMIVERRHSHEETHI